jgi:hypothetical protein
MTTNRVFICTLLILLFLAVLFSAFTHQRQVDLFDYTNSIKTLLRQSARYTTAANQDQDPVIANLHANYGAAYLWALQDIFSNQTIEDITGVNLLHYKREVQRIQDDTTKRLFTECPQLVPKTYVGQVAIQTGENQIKK